jgi:hypothetical protein
MHLEGILTPKGLNVRTADKPVLVCVTWAHTIFWFFETFFEYASFNKLHGKKKTHFLDLRIKSYGCLKSQGKVWVGRACAEANEKELTTCAKSRGQEEKKIQEKWEQPDRSRRQSAASGRSLVVSRPWAADLRLSGCPNFFEFFEFLIKKWISGSLGNGPRLLGEWVYNTPIFWSLSLHLEVLILPKFMESGDFTFFQKK